MAISNIPKLCRKCSEYKDVESFYNNKNYKDGKDIMCAVCRKKALNDSREKKYFRKLVDDISHIKQTYDSLGKDITPDDLPKNISIHHKDRVQAVWEFLFPSATMPWYDPDWKSSTKFADYVQCTRCQILIHVDYFNKELDMCNKCIDHIKSPDFVAEVEGLLCACGDNFLEIGQKICDSCQFLVDKKIEMEKIEDEDEIIEEEV